MSGFDDLAGEWKLPLLESFDDLQEVESVAFPIQTLPPTIASFCREVGRVAQAPLEISGAACLSTLSACLGKGVIIPNAFRGDSTKPTLQTIVACESGAGKSGVFGVTMASMNNWIEEERSQFLDKESHRIQAKKTCLEVEIQKLTNEAKNKQNGAKNREDIEIALAQAYKKYEDLKRSMGLPQYMAEDSTIEALAVTLGENGKVGQEAVFVTSDDARQLLATLQGKYTNGDVNDNLWVKGWGWSPHRQLRRGDGGSVDLQAPCVNAFLMIQPDLMDKLAGHPQLMNSGFLQRVLLDEIEWPLEEYRDPGGYDLSITGLWGELVHRLLSFYRKAKTPHFVEITPEARRILDEYRNQLILRIRNPADLGDVQSVAARWAEWAGRLALNFHCAEHIEEAGRVPLDVETARKGIVMADYYSKRKLAALYCSRDTRKRRIRTDILELAQERDFITAADVQRKRLARTAEEARLHLRQLVSAGQFKEREIRNPKGGPPSYRFYLPEKFNYEPVINVTNDINQEISQPF